LLVSALIAKCACDVPSHRLMDIDRQSHFCWHLSVY